ncbi:MAG: RNA polymerase sigma factor [Opitutales bacterium]
MVAAISPSLPARSIRHTANRSTRTALAGEEARHDAALVLRFNAGDQAAFVEIVGRYRGKMFQAALSLLRNRADAEEIAQDTFIRAHHSLARFRGDSPLATWLYCITLNLARNRYWYCFRRRRHATLPLDAPLREGSPATLAELIASNTPGPVREVVNNEFLEILAACAERLTPVQREILLLRNGQHHSYRSISRRLGLGLGTVKSRIARARRCLRHLVAEACPEFRLGASLSGPFESFRASGPLEAACA